MSRHKPDAELVQAFQHFVHFSQIYFSENQYENALEYLEAAIEIKKDYAKAYETIGVIYQNSADSGNAKDYTKAIYYYEQAVGYDRRNYKVMCFVRSSPISPPYR